MRIANTRDFQVALLQVIRHANQPHPSRGAIAERLESLGERLGARKAPAKEPKAPGSRLRKKKDAPPIGRQVLVNIAQKEAQQLDYLKMTLAGAVSEVKKEVKEIREGIERLQEDAKLDDKELSKADVDEKWAANDYFSGMLLDSIINAVDFLAGTLEDHENITQETELAKAVRDFQKKIPDEGTWPKGKGEKQFNEVIKALSSAAAMVPTGLSKPSELTKLREVFEGIADIAKLMTGKSVSVPKIPKALDPEDPRQLGFGFSASSRRIASTAELKGQLDAIWQASSEPHPSRQALGAALFNIASSLR
jgi:hypothetical protein